MELLNVLEWLMSLPAEYWLVPPVIIIGVIVVIGFTRRQILLRQWEDIARRVNLQLNPNNIFNSPIISGDYRGYKISMTIISQRNDPWRRDGTLITMQIDNPADIRFTLERQGVLDVLATAAGMQDIKLGDETFDRHFVVRCKPAAPAEELLADSHLREGLIKTNAYRIHLVSGTLTCHMRSVQRDPAHVEMVLNTLSDLADGIDRIKPPEDKVIIRG